MNQRNVTFIEVEQVVKQLHGHCAWRNRAGSGTGSIFTLQFGPALAADEAQGEFSLMVYCAWRIVEANNILCTWHGDSETVLAPALKALEGMQVTKATLSELGDLAIYFSAGLSLQIWNDSLVESYASWSFGYKGIGYFAVEVGKEFVFEAK